MNEPSRFFVGWFRRGSGRWRRIVEGQTADEVWTLLPGLAPADRNRDLCVLPDGRDPNARAADLHRSLPGMA